MKKWRFKMLYDGACPICQAEIRRLNQWNQREYLVFEDISTDMFSAEKYGKTYDQLMGKIHGVYPDGRIISGMEVFRASYGAVGKGWLLAPTQWPIFDRCFEYLYKHFARHRVGLGRLFGRCNSD
jgi:predicted DCC family thiol-disulfide oxidoreductase YuxK